jgi:hypothetical protein
LFADRQITNPVLSISDSDLPDEQVRDNEPLVVATNLGSFEVHRIFIDKGSLADIVFWSLFDKMGFGSKFLTEEALLASQETR